MQPSWSFWNHYINGTKDATKLCPLDKCFAFWESIWEMTTRVERFRSLILVREEWVSCNNVCATMAKKQTLPFYWICLSPTTMQMSWTQCHPHVLWRRGSATREEEEHIDRCCHVVDHDRDQRTVCRKTKNCVEWMNGQEQSNTVTHQSWGE